MFDSEEESNKGESNKNVRNPVIVAPLAIQ